MTPLALGRPRALTWEGEFMYSVPMAHIPGFAILIIFTGGGYNLETGKPSPQGGPVVILRFLRHMNRSLR